MKPALRFPSPNWAPETPPASQTFTDPRLAPALLVTVLLCWGFWLVGYLSGRSAERGSQLAVVAGMVIRGPTIDSLADSSRAVLRRWAEVPSRPRQPAAARRAKPLGAAPASPRETHPAAFTAPLDTARWR